MGFTFGLDDNGNMSVSGILRVSIVPVEDDDCCNFVDCRPCLSCCKCPLAVASEGRRYFFTKSYVRSGQETK